MKGMVINMRITNNMVFDKYMRNLNNAASQLSNLNEQVASERSFLKISDDPVSALKAFKVRRDTSRTELFQTNIKDISSTLTEVESSVSSINDCVSNAATLILQGKSGTYSAEDRKVIASSLRSFQEQILSSANSKFSGKYLFGGSGVSDMPFTLDDDGNLLYKGQNVDTGTFTDTNKYIDIGLGLQYESSGEIASESAMNVSYSGAELLGTGLDSNNVPNNLYNVIDGLADMFEANDFTNFELYQNKLSDKADDIRLQYVSIGEQSSFVEYIGSRLDITEVNNAKKTQTLEGIDMAKAIVSFTSQQNIYDACLKMGSKIILPSLIDYLN